MAWDRQQGISTYSSGYRSRYKAVQFDIRRRLRNSGTGATQLHDILVGTLVMDVEDTKKNQLAWHGIGVKEVDTQAQPEKHDKSISSAMKKIFKNYPAEDEDIGTGQAPSQTVTEHRGQEGPPSSIHSETNPISKPEAYGT